MARRSPMIIFPALAIVVSASCASASVSGTSLPAGPATEVSATSGEKGAASMAPQSSVVAATSSPGTVPAGNPSATSPTALSVLATIRVARENPGGYLRTKFKHWTDADGDGCNTREEVLIAESSSNAQVMWPGCKVVEGDWVSRYDGAAVTDPAGLDIDHFVPLKEAWDSGAFTWTSSQREQFANDQSDPRALVAVTASTNRSKSDKDPPQWMPPNSADLCPYLSDWVVVKAHWSLTMDESEFGFISKRLRGQCAGTTAQPWGSPASSKVPSGTGAAPPSGSGSDQGTDAGDTVKGALPTIHPGSWCTPKGAYGTYKSKTYVCSTTKATGQAYADNRAHWRPE